MNDLGLIDRARRARPAPRSLHRLAIAAWLLVLAGCVSDVGTDPVGRFTEEEIAYFLDIALGTEYGGGAAIIRKWTDDVRIAVHGAPTDADLATLEAVVWELDELVRPISITIDQANPNVDVHFAPESAFTGILPQYVPGNLGFFWVWWTSASVIVEATILIETERTSQAARSHLIREEVTQILGLMRDSYRYPESIFGSSLFQMG